MNGTDAFTFAALSCCFQPVDDTEKRVAERTFTRLGVVADVSFCAR
jgi:hypothetical protein